MSRLVFLALVLALGAPSHGRAAAPPPPARLGAAASTPVEFGAAGEPRLRGRQYGAGTRWVVLVHDEGQDSRAWRGLPGELSAQGFRVLVFDRRGYGASDGPRDASRARSDVAAALDFARSRGARRLYVVGAGAGAGAALVAARAYPVSAFVALSPRRGGRGELRQTRAPKLILVGSLDDRAATQADAVFRRGIGFATLNSIPVALQGTELLRSSWGDDALELILAFLRDYFS